MRTTLSKSRGACSMETHRLRPSHSRRLGTDQSALGAFRVAYKQFLTGRGRRFSTVLPGRGKRIGHGRQPSTWQHSRYLRGSLRNYRVKKKQKWKALARNLDSFAVARSILPTAMKTS